MCIDIPTWSFSEIVCCSASIALSFGCNEFRNSSRLSLSLIGSIIEVNIRNYQNNYTISTSAQIGHNWRLTVYYLLFALLNCCLSASMAFSASFACCLVLSSSCCNAVCWDNARSALSFTSRNRASRSSFSWKHYRIQPTNSIST